MKTWILSSFSQGNRRLQSLVNFFFHAFTIVLENERSPESLFKVWKDTEPAISWKEIKMPWAYRKAFCSQGQTSSWHYGIRHISLRLAAIITVRRLKSSVSFFCSLLMSPILQIPQKQKEWTTLFPIRFKKPCK